MSITKRLASTILSIAAGAILYVYAALSVFGPEHGSSGFDLFVVIFLTIVGGFASLAFGYGSVLVFGGSMSLWLTDFFARVTKSVHVIEAVSEEKRDNGDRAVRDFMIYMPVLVFTLATILSWDMHNLHSQRTSIFHPVLHALDIFSKQVVTEPLSHTIDFIPAMLILVFIAGMIPSTVLPYFRRFKITGVNSGPFHTNFLFTAMGTVVGVGAVLTLIGLIYEVMWVGGGPYQYHYLLPTMLGLSLHYTIGAYLAREKSEEMVTTRLKASPSRRIFQGTVSIQSSASDEKRKP